MRATKIQKFKAISLCSLDSKPVHCDVIKCCQRYPDNCHCVYELHHICRLTKNEIRALAVASAHRGNTSMLALQRIQRMLKWLIRLSAGARTHSTNTNCVLYVYIFIQTLCEELLVALNVESREALLLKHLADTSIVRR